MFLLEEIFLGAAALIGFLVAAKLLKRSRGTTTLSLAIYFASSTFNWLGILVYYVLVDMGSYPYEFIGHHAQLDLTAITIAGIAGTIFAVLSIFPNRKKLLSLPMVLGIFHAIGIWLIPYEILENDVKWCHFHPRLIYLGFVTLIPLLLIPGILFLVYSVQMYKVEIIRKSVEMKRSICLASGFLLMGIALVFEAYGILTQILVFWHSMVLLSFVLLYSGFILGISKE
jgi:hypothetical protein